MDDDFVKSLGRHGDVFRELGDREPANSIEAQAIIENIREDKGYLDDETLQDLHTLGQRSQDRLLRIVKLKRETEAAYTTNISEQLYSSKYRFLYELIQNADDSKYNKCSSSNDRPYLRFRVEPHAFIVETNEDGFTRPNIEAICATGKSSKKVTEADDHIGEKGFGFKSVFSIANEVQVQSGLWSFYFRHQKGQDGLGMVTPLDAVPEILPKDVTTRITLRYSNETKQEYARLLEAIQDLPDTTVLFLQRLEKFHIEVTGLDGQCDKTSFVKQFNFQRSRCTIARSKVIGNRRTEAKCIFLLFRSMKKDMPPHERRPNRTKAKIELAFPIDPDTQQPKLSDSGQHVFAFLPLQRLAQIQFSIHSDFVTSANRESVIDCSWNHALCDAIAQTFVSAVCETFAKSDHPLRYSWLDFLPEKTPEHPWRSIYPLIIGALASKAVVQTWERRQFKAPNQIRQLVQSAIHSGQPILPDMADEIYLAPDYSDRHKMRLKELGTQIIGWDDLIDRLQADLLNLQSRTKTTEALDAWHEAFAGLFSRAFSPNSSLAIQQRIKKLGLIPLTSPNQWTGAPGATRGGSNKVYFAYTESTPIPETTSLRLLDRTASLNLKRKAFYKILGVEECPKETVFAKIKERHQSLVEPGGVVNELRYLYNQHYGPNDLRAWVRVPLTNGDTVKAADCDLFFPSDGAFDLYRLVPDARHAFLSEEIFNAEPSTVRVDNESWKEWLARMTAARYFPSLIGGPQSSGTRLLSPALKSVLEHEPTKFMDTLKVHWHEYQHDAHLVKEDLRNCLVPCQSGITWKLRVTYLPTAEVLAEAHKLGVPKDELPLLKLADDTLNQVTYRSWKFLEDFGVRSEPDILFYGLAIMTKSKKEITISNVDQVADIYRGMARLATIQDYEQIRIIISPTSRRIWDGYQGCWAMPEQCILNGPACISGKTVLMRTYSSDTLLDSFFSTILRVPNWTFQDVIEEIELRRDGRASSASLSLMRDVYKLLAKEAEDVEVRLSIKAAFAKKKLVLGQNDTWHTLSTCLWKSPFALEGFQDLSTIYGGLESFFVRRLQVKKATPSMLIKEVKRMSTETLPRISDIRTRLIEIGVMLAKVPIDESITSALESLREAKFLPKRLSGATSVLVGVASDYAIADHQRYGDAFAGYDVLLDFQVYEVQTLHAVFRHLGLTHRYLSSTVKEVSTVGENSNQHETLSQQLQAKAYALYCCAAKYKSNKALRGDNALFEQLSQALVYTSDEITTNLVLPLVAGSVSVQSDRAFVHHDTSGGRIKIYVPSDDRQRRACYRSQLPQLLTTILGVSANAAFNLSSIVTSTLQDLEDVLVEQDIPPVQWIDRPTIVVPDIADDERPVTPISVIGSNDTATLVGSQSRVVTPEATPARHDRTASAVDVGYSAETTPPAQYPDFIEQVVRSAQRAGYRNRGAEAAVANTPPRDEEYHHFDHQATFGIRSSANTFVHDRRIGAAGEAYVYEMLNALNLPNFTEANWRSTIRGELSRSTHFENMQNWVGRETADIVYKDQSGELTKYLRDHSEGIFPHQIPMDWDFTMHSIEYYLEVKTTPGRCGTRFYMSGGQYKRMETMALELVERPTKVYVIMRVYNLMTPNVGMKVFVDPLQFKGSKLDFEAEQWFVSTM